MTKAIAIYPDKTLEEVDVDGLADYQAIVEGWIEPVTLKFGTMYVNEEFTYKFGPEDVNWTASDVAGMGGRTDLLLFNPILGPAFLIGPVDDEGNDTDITEAAVRAVKKVAREAGATWRETV